VEAEPAPPPVASVSPLATARSDVAIQLPRELEYLERTRALLAHESPGAALEALSDYERAFPRGTMKVEASAFRVEALAAAGRRQEAALQARAFLAAYPKNPMAERIRGVLLRLETIPPRP